MHNSYKSFFCRKLRMYVRHPLSLRYLQKLRDRQDPGKAGASIWLCSTNSTNKLSEHQKDGTELVTVSCCKNKKKGSTCSEKASLEEGRGGRKRLPLSIPAILTDYNIY
jgi:hypothetical protein